MSTNWSSLWLCVTIITTILNSVKGYSITVDAHAEECFFDHVEAGTKMGKFYT